MLIKTNLKLKLAVLVACLTLFGSLSLGSVLAAAAQKTKSSNPGSATSSSQPPAASVQGYSSTSPLQVGLIVQLTGAGASNVAVATQKDAGHMYGVTIDPNSLSFTISSSTLQNEVYVATSGTYNVIVSTQKGPIAAGDYVTISSIDGVAMDAGTDNTTVFGRAGASFDGKTNVVGSESLTGSNGTQSVNLGIIPVAIQIERNPDVVSTKTNLPKELQKVGLAVADKPIGPLKTYLSIAILATGIVMSLTILYAGIRNSVISVGRNPLSRGRIFRTLLTVVFTGMVVLIISFLAVYLLLKL